jgi:hypothetical protein
LNQRSDSYSWRGSNLSLNFKILGNLFEFIQMVAKLFKKELNPLFFNSGVLWPGWPIRPSPFSPAGPPPFSLQAATSTRPTGRVPLAQPGLVLPTGLTPPPSGPSHVGVIAEMRVLFDLVHSVRDTFSLSHHCHVGPICQLHPLPPLPPADRCHSLPPATPRRPASNLEMPGNVFTQRLDFTLNFTP